MYIQLHDRTHLDELRDGYTAPIGGGVVAIGELYQMHPVVGDRFEYPLYITPDKEE